MTMDEVQVSRGGSNEDKTLLQCSQLCYKGEFQHVSISAQHMLWSESSWAFPESYNANDSWIMRLSDGGLQEDKRAHNSTIKVNFCTIIIIMFVSLHDSDDDGVVRIFVAFSCEL